MSFTLHSIASALHDWGDVHTTATVRDTVRSVGPFILLNDADRDACMELAYPEPDGGLMGTIKFDDGTEWDGYVYAGDYATVEDLAEDILRDYYADTGMRA